MVVLHHLVIYGGSDDNGRSDSGSIITVVFQIAGEFDSYLSSLENLHYSIYFAYGPQC